MQALRCAGDKRDGLRRAQQKLREAFARGENQLLTRERVADLDTPVGAFLKLADGKPHAFLLSTTSERDTADRKT